MVRAFPEIVDQHAEEAAFLWLLRDQATHAPNYDLNDLAELDERVDAHLDGLRVAGALGWETCVRELEWGEAGEVFAAAHLALQSRIGRRVSQVLDVAAQSAELARGFIAALAWFPFDDVRDTIGALVDSTDPVARHIGIAATAAHRRDPGPTLRHAATHDDGVVRVRAIKAAAELGRQDLLPICKEREPTNDSVERFWTGWSGALLGSEDLSALCDTAVSGGPLAEPACDVATRRMSGEAASAWRRYLADAPRGSRVAITAARAHGDPAAIPWLIDLMASRDLARLAGEAFSFITGVGLEASGLSAQRPDGFESGPNDDPDDDNVEMDPDEDLPWPSQAAIHAWWAHHRGRFNPGSRYLLGCPIQPDTLRDALARGTQRQRAAAALELVLQHPGQPLFEVRARAVHQQRTLASWGFA